MRDEWTNVDLDVIITLLEQYDRQRKSVLEFIRSLTDYTIGRLFQQEHTNRR